MPSAKFNDDSGSVVLEFLGFGVLLQVPILMFATTVLGLQHDKFAAEAITRDALRSYTLLQIEPSATVLDLAKAYKVSLGRIKVEMTCWPQACGNPENWVGVTTKIGSATAQGLARQ
jgi:hypothetical protein